MSVDVPESRVLPPGVFPCVFTKGVGVRCLNPDGSVRWQFDVAGATCPYAIEDKVFVCSNNHEIGSEVIALDRHTGAELYRKPVVLVGKNPLEKK